MKRTLIGLSLVALFVSGTALARDHQLPSLKLSIAIPDDWKVEVEGDLTTAGPPSEDLALVMWEAGRIKDMQKVLDEIGKELEKLITDAKVDGDAQETKVNGLDTVFIDGTGKIEGEDIAWSLAVIHNGSKKFLVVLGFAEPDAVKKHAKKLESIFKSIKKI